MLRKILPEKLHPEEEVFLKKTSKLKLSPAQLQEFLFKYRDEESILALLSELKDINSQVNPSLGSLYT